MRRLLSFLPKLWANWVTLFGAVVTTISALAILVFALIALVSKSSNPYSGIFAIVFLFMFIGGLALIPIGFIAERWLAKRRARSNADGSGVVANGEPDPITRAFTLAIKDQRSRRLILFVGALTVTNVILVAVGGVRAMAYMDTPAFCGAACHTPMEPEWSAYHRSPHPPHQKVNCVDCHIGPGAGALVEAKLNGMHQLFGVITGSYHRPIPPPAHMRPTDVTCEGCHARERFIGDRAKLFPHYKPTQDNEGSFNVMIDHVGGLDPRTGQYTGIHSHLAPNKTISYEFLDAKHTKIGDITVVENGAVKAVYSLPAETAKQPVLGVATMQCTDCHNRPTHKFDGTAQQAVDQAMWNGELDSKQPYLNKVAVEVLAKANVQHDAADSYFKAAVESAYGALDAKPVPSDLDKAEHAIAAIYRRNVFPTMNVTWNTYPDLIGHHSETDDSAVGCMRCHDGTHQATLASGQIKKMDRSCDLCHASVASSTAPTKFDDATKQLVGIPLD